MLQQDNLVIIRVWHSGLHGGAGVGHVSIQIPRYQDLYISLWPKDRSPRIQAAFRPTPHAFMTYEQDLTLEGRPPESEIRLYSLSAGAIKNAYDRKRATLAGWQLCQGIYFSSPEGGGESCASLAYFLLTHGGIYDLTASSATARFSSSSLGSSATPDELALVLKAAKKQEEKRHPETKNFPLQPATATDEENEGESIQSRSARCGMTCHLL